MNKYITNKHNRFTSSPFREKFFYLIVALLVLSLISTGAVFTYVSASTPDFSKKTVSQSTLIYDRNGKFLYEYHHDVRRIPVPLSQMPQHLKAAIVAIEDKDFYQHSGLDLSGILRAMKTNIEEKALKQGGSTITQQLVRNRVLSRKKEFSRKIKEAVLAIEVELKYDKDEILEMYLNEIPFGSTAYGVEAASQLYFDKHAAELTLEESAYLAALPKAPSYYSPFGPNRDELDGRAQLVLSKMQEHGYITKQELDQSRLDLVTFEQSRAEINAPHFVFYVLDQLVAKLGEETVKAGGLEVRTTLDLDLHNSLQEMLTKHVEEFGPRYSFSNSASVVLSPKTGEVLSMIGSRDFFDDQIDGQVNVTLSQRQPGSSFKPYAYAAAFSRGYSPATMLLDVPTDFTLENGNKKYTPQNYNSSFRGPVSARDALQGSLNIPAVKILTLAGIDNTINTAETLGIKTLTSRSRYGPALVLGGGEVTLLEHTGALGAFGNEGKAVPPRVILSVEDENNKNIYSDTSKTYHQAVNPEVAYQINHVLSDYQSRSYVFGLSSPLNVPGHSVAAKTGTTQEFRDAWTIGYTPDFALGVWIGNNDNTPMRYGAAGSVVAAPLWNKMISHVLAGQPAAEFRRPAGIVEMKVDTLTGKLPTEYTPKTKTEIFSAQNKPAQYDDAHLALNFDGQQKVITRLRSEKPNNPYWEAGVREWAASAGFAYGTREQIVEQEKQKAELAKKALDGNIIAPSVIQTLPWSISVNAPKELVVQAAEIYLNDQLILSHPTARFTYHGSHAPKNGFHKFRVRLITEDNTVIEAEKTVLFDLAEDSPQLAYQTTDQNETD